MIPTMEEFTKQMNEQLTKELEDLMNKPMDSNSDCLVGRKKKKSSKRDPQREKRILQIVVNTETDRLVRERFYNNNKK